MKPEISLLDDILAEIKNDEAIEKLITSLQFTLNSDQNTLKDLLALIEGIRKYTKMQEELKILYMRVLTQKQKDAQYWLKEYLKLKRNIKL